MSCLFAHVATVLQIVLFSRTVCKTVLHLQGPLRRMRLILDFDHAAIHHTAADYLVRIDVADPNQPARTRAVLQSPRPEPSRGRRRSSPPSAPNRAAFTRVASPLAVPARPFVRWRHQHMTRACHAHLPRLDARELQAEVHLVARQQRLRLGGGHLREIELGDPSIQGTGPALDLRHIPDAHQPDCHGSVRTQRDDDDAARWRRILLQRSTRAIPPRTSSRSSQGSVAWQVT